VKKLKIWIGAALLAIGMFGTAEAKFIEGQLGFAGLAQVERAGGEYTKIDFVFAQVINATKDYASIPLFSPISVNLLEFPLQILPTTIWSIGTFSFELDAVTINDGTTVGGTGLILGDGFDDTKGFWSFTSLAESSSFVFGSSSTFATPIPAAIWLFGTALIGLVGSAKRKSRFAT
jgi:hypothetical protein